jgi:alkanesulfonate monooxygenase SsuD/methylene tetrahydromethanopterin reductase-like flavin-dependent oxidoreductase (luciferase family)
MRIGLMHGEGGPESVNSFIDRVVQEEKDGFDTAWFGQIFLADSLTLIALAGRVTSRIEFGAAVIPTYTRHPVAMAQQAATVQESTGGRFTLGIGPSHQIVVENMWGLSYDKPAKHVREYLSVLLPLVREGKVSFSGACTRSTRIDLIDMKPLPVLISALAVMRKLAGAVPTVRRRG